MDYCNAFWKITLMFFFLTGYVCLLSVERQIRRELFMMKWTLSSRFIKQILCCVCLFQNFSVSCLSTWRPNKYAPSKEKAETGETISLEVTKRIRQLFIKCCIYFWWLFLCLISDKKPFNFQLFHLNGNAEKGKLSANCCQPAKSRETSCIRVFEVCSRSPMNEVYWTPVCDKIEGAVSEKITSSVKLRFFLRMTRILISLMKPHTEALEPLPYTTGIDSQHHWSLFQSSG